MLGILVLSLALIYALVETKPTVWPTGDLLTRNTSLQWGPYRPNVYLGIRSQEEQSLVFGLMWAAADNSDAFPKHLRHTCEQDEGMDGYGWTKYSPRFGGTQTIHDPQNNINITAGFTRAASTDRNGWGLRTTGALQSSKTQGTTLVFYIGSEEPNATFNCTSGDSDGGLDLFSCSGHRQDQTEYRIAIKPNDGHSPALSLCSIVVAPHRIWQAKSLYIDQCSSRGDDLALAHGSSNGNLHFLQLTYSGVFEIDMLYTETTSQHTAFTSTVLDKGLSEASENFDRMFKAVYDPQPPFHDKIYTKFSQSMLSNLLGGIGYFSGTSMVNSDLIAEKESSTSSEEHVKERGPYKLFSAVPSRPFFPRGFLWDEGFHLQIIVSWDLDLAASILASWLDLMDDNGWIAREQILGDEARSKVPAEFRTQYQTYANPPTLFLAFQEMADFIMGTVEYHGEPSTLVHASSSSWIPSSTENAGELFLKNVLQKLSKHYSWFRSTQAGSLEHYHVFTAMQGTNFTEGYRWRGRTAKHILTSGMDDYPRAQNPSSSELHLDALCWVGLMNHVLQYVAASTQSLMQQQVLNLQQEHVEIVRSLNQIHWSETDQAFCDITIINGQPAHVCHKGYLSLLPLLTGIALNNQTPQVRTGAMLNIMASRSHLWTDYGLRSLSASDKFYGTEENYWRSPIWVNINYMALTKLLTLASGQDSLLRGRATQIYTQLRNNIVKTVFESWHDTGFAWEQYNPDTGRGQRTQHFTGWTALVVRIMAMPDLESQAAAISTTHPGLEHQSAHSMSVFASLFLGNSNLLLLTVCILVAIVIVFRRRIIRSSKSLLETH